MRSVLLWKDYDPFTVTDWDHFECPLNFMRSALLWKNYDCSLWLCTENSKALSGFMRSALLWKDYDFKAIGIEKNIQIGALWDQPCFERITTFHLTKFTKLFVICFMRSALLWKDYDIGNTIFPPIALPAFMRSALLWKDYDPTFRWCCTGHWCLYEISLALKGLRLSFE